MKNKIKLKTRDGKVIIVTGCKVDYYSNELMITYIENGKQETTVVQEGDIVYTELE